MTGPGIGEEWDDLFVFRAVAEELSFTRGARRVHLSVPTVSQRVRRLERRLGHELLRRTTVRVELTPAGADLLEWIDTAAASWSQLRRRWEDAAAHAEVSPVLPARVVVGVSQVNSAQLHRRLVADLPAVEWVMHLVAGPGAGMDRLRDGAVDVLVWQSWPFSDRPDTAGTVSHTVWRSPIWIYLPPDHPRRTDADVDLAVMRGEPLIGRADPEVNEVVVRFYRSVGGFTPRFTHISDDPAEVEHLIRTGQGIDIGSAGARPPRDIVRRPIIRAPGAPMHLTWRSAQASAPLARVLLDQVRRVCADNLAEVNPELCAAILADPRLHPELRTHLGTDALVTAGPPDEPEPADGPRPGDRPAGERVP